MTIIQLTTVQYLKDRNTISGGSRNSQRGIKLRHLRYSYVGLVEVTQQGSEAHPACEAWGSGGMHHRKKLNNYPSEIEFGINTTVNSFFCCKIYIFLHVELV